MAPQDPGYHSFSCLFMLGHANLSAGWKTCVFPCVTTAYDISGHSTLLNISAEADSCPQVNLTYGSRDKPAVQIRHTRRNVTFGTNVSAICETYASYRISKGETRHKFLINVTYENSYVTKQVQVRSGPNGNLAVIMLFMLVIGAMACVYVLVKPKCVQEVPYLRVTEPRSDVDR